ncbi:aquaporin [Streptomyces sp. NPDC088794]|uniref:aquaporin n=1 Tax=Streptomyces sp. NPDC088794 TaxID=3365902 RepID=UPI0037FAD3ED
MLSPWGRVTGGHVNPAREFGPAVFAGDLSLLPVYLLAPPMGALPATAVIRRVG